MDIAAWIVTGLLVLVFGGAGAMKLARSRAQILENPNMAWATDFSQPAIKLIGVAEVLGAVGLVLPWAVDVLPVLTPAAGFGLAALMVGAVIVHLRRREFAVLPVGAILVAGAVFVAVARVGAL